VNGEEFRVQVSYDQDSPIESTKPTTNGQAQSVGLGTKEIISPLEGKVFSTKESTEKAIKVGDKISVGDIVCYIEAMKVSNAIKADKSGTVTELLFKDGDDVMDDEVLIRLS
jgi:pyruvate carboxylase subunit B